LTRDGGQSWSDVTPKEVTPWTKVTQIDASHFGANTAYLSASRFRVDDLTPLVFRTHDGGSTWTKIVRGLADNAPVNVVREDPTTKGLLYCGTERGVYVSFNDGDDWQPVTLNLPHSSVRDLIVHGDDLVVATHGRGFWILDNMTPLREIAVRSAKAAALQPPAFLYKPQTAYRLRRNNNTDTPLPPEVPAARNPPDGAIIDYYLRREGGPVVLEIYDPSSRLVRRYSSEDKPEVIDEKDYQVPAYWFRPPQILSKQAGMQRFIWDLHYTPPRAERYDFPISAIYRDTPPTPQGPAAHPGQYTVKLTAGGRTYTRTLIVRIDPRVKTAPDALRRQFDLSMQTYDGMNRSFDALAEVKRLRARIKELKDRAGAGALSGSLDALDQKLAAISEGGGSRRGGASAAGTNDASLAQVNSALESLLELLQSADAQPTTQAIAAAADLQQKLDALLTRFGEIRSTDVRALDDGLRRANLPTLSSTQ
jgi:hypothetical protein